MAASMRHGSRLTGLLVCVPLPRTCGLHSSRLVVGLGMDVALLSHRTPSERAQKFDTPYEYVLEIRYEVITLRRRITLRQTGNSEHAVLSRRYRSCAASCPDVCELL